MRISRTILIVLGGWVTLTMSGPAWAGQNPWVTYDGSDGPGNGKHIVLISGDEEYRSEEALPQLAKILAEHHGFKTTVLFSIDEETGEIDPETLDNTPGLENLESADLMVIATRFRNLPDEQMKRIVEYIESGRPVIGLRTATHAFNIPEDREYHRYSFNSGVEGWEDGFGRQVLGETWIAHHGQHGSESTLGILAEDVENHPILRGIEDGDIWGPTDVYEVRLPLPGHSQPLVLGQVLSGMKPDSEPVTGEKNDPMMPIAWTKTYETESGETTRVFTTTMGAAEDLSSEGLRRLLVNASYWALGMEDQISPDADVSVIGEYTPTAFGFGDHRRGVKPLDHEMTAEERKN